VSAAVAPGALAVGKQPPRRGQALAEVARPIGIGSLVLAVVLLGLWLWAGFQPAVVRRQSVTLKYHEEIGLTYSAAVTPGAIYAKAALGPDDLPRWQTQSDPPIFRRALVTRPLERLTVEFPYTLTFDRPVTITGTTQAAAFLVGQHLWQRPLTLVAPQEVRGQGTSVSGSLKIDLDVRALADQIVRGYEEAGLVPSAGELWIDPVLDWQATGAGDTPITGSLTGTRLVVYLLGDHLEIEEKQPATKDQSLTTAQQQVNTLGFGAQRVPLATVRRYAGPAAALLAMIGLLCLWLAHRFATAAVSPAEGVLGRLALTIDAAELKLDPSWAVIQLTEPKDLLRLHTATGRPIVRVGTTYHLLDGTTCYSYRA
jgi:hypothetical protein